jgi:protein O-mannosyl-transferase
MRLLTSEPAKTKSTSRISHLHAIAGWCATHQTLCFALLSGAWVLALYWKALVGAPFVYDDLDQIVKNPDLGSFHEMFMRFFFAPSAFTSHFRGVGGSNYRPLFWLSLSIDRHVWGVQGASGFHFTNIFLHWGNGLLLFLLLRRLSITGMSAASTAFIWLGMPINSEAVAWVSGRAYLLCGLFLLLALWSAHYYLIQERLLPLIGVFASSLAALLSHESGLLFLPLAVLLSCGIKTLPKRSTWILISVSGASDLLFLCARHFVGASAGGGKAAIWPVGKAFWKYWLWMIAPVHMSIERSTSTPPNAFSPGSLVALCSVVMLCLGIGLVRKSAPPLAAGLAWSVIAILPFCGLIFIYQGMAERYEYLASAGLALAVSSLVFQHTKFLSNVIACLAIVWIVWGAWRLKSRVLDWCDPVALYQSSLQATPDAMLFYDLGWAWREKGAMKKALADYQEAIRHQPDYQEAYASVGQVLSILGRPKEAVPAYNRALALSEDDSDTRVDLAVTLAQLGDKQSSEWEFRKALAFTPKNISALNDLGSLLILEGRSDEGIHEFQQAIKDNPSDKTAYFNLAALFQQQGNKEKALEFYQKVLQLSPNDPNSLSNMRLLYEKQ